MYGQRLAQPGHIRGLPLANGTPPPGLADPVRDYAPGHGQGEVRAACAGTRRATRTNVNSFDWMHESAGRHLGLPALEGDRHLPMQAQTSKPGVQHRATGRRSRQQANMAKVDYLQNGSKCLGSGGTH